LGEIEERDRDTERHRNIETKRQIGRAMCPHKELEVKQVRRHREKK
jgi:hypothetical protein